MKKRRKKSASRKRKRTTRTRTRTNTIVKYRTRTRPSKARRRRRSGSSGSVKLSMAGLKKILTPVTILMAAAGAVGARAVYGLIRGQAPELDPKLTALIATAATVAAGIMLGKKTKHAGPVAVGALAALILDIGGPEIASAISDAWPDGADAISVGMGTEPIMVAPPITDPTLTDLGQSGLPDAYGMADERQSLPDAYGMGQLDMVSVLPYM